MNPGPIIEAKDLSRWYGLVLGLNKISFSILPGITGLVGPNGAGKSTLIQIINGRLKPSSGTINVFGQSPWNNPSVLKSIGYCPEKESIHEYMKPVEWLTSLGLISGISPREIKDHAVDALRLTQLDEKHWSKSLGQYSKGMRQRVKLAQALIHRPKLVILDEPMNGLDPMARAMVGDILKSIAANGTSVIISSHILHELETLSSRLILMNWGRIIGSGTPDEISAQTHRTKTEKLTIQCSNPMKLVEILFREDAINGFELDRSTNEISITLHQPERFYQNIVHWIDEQQIEIGEIRHQSKSLQSLFQQLTN